MTDAPSAVQYGKVIGRFVRFVADGPDPGSIPDELPLNGSIILTPTITAMRWAGTTPPRMAILEKLVCKIVDGELCAPGSSEPGVWVVATEQPSAAPSRVQWKATFAITDLAVQPSPVLFDVPIYDPADPASGVIDLSVVVPVSADPGTVTVVSHADRVAAEAAADRAERIADEMAAATPTWWVGTLAEYDAFPTHDPGVLYVISTSSVPLRHWWTGTQAELDAIASRDNQTLYVVQEA